jgi:ATP-dependent DNA ligase
MLYETTCLLQCHDVTNRNLTVKVFDILMINGISLLEKSTMARRKNLHHTVQEVKGRIEYATAWEGRTSKDVRERMEEIMNARLIPASSVL